MASHKNTMSRMRAVRKWLSATDIVYLMTIMYGVSYAGAAISYDLLVAAMLEPLDTAMDAVQEARFDEGSRKQRRNTQRQVLRSNLRRVMLVNCGASWTSGSHWVLALMCRDGDQNSVVLWDSLGHTKYSEVIKKELEQKVSGISVSLFATNVQHDGWRCGYIAVFWWLILQDMVQNPLMPGNIPLLPPPPPNWEVLMHKLLEYRSSRALHGLNFSQRFKDPIKGEFNLQQFWERLPVSPAKHRRPPPKVSKAATHKEGREKKTTRKKKHAARKPVTVTAHTKRFLPQSIGMIISCNALGACGPPVLVKKIKGLERDYIDKIQFRNFSTAAQGVVNAQLWLYDPATVPDTVVWEEYYSIILPKFTEDCRHQLTPPDYSDSSEEDLLLT